MPASPDPVSRDVVVVNEFGLHARSAARIAHLAKNARAGIWVWRGKIPTSPSTAGATNAATVPEKLSAAALTMST